TPSSSIAGSQQQGGKKTINRPPPQPTLPAVRHGILELFARLPPQRCPHCRKWICNEPRAEQICQSSARSRTHKSPCPARFQANRTLSGLRRITESDPRLPLPDKCCCDARCPRVLLNRRFP